MGEAAVAETPLQLPRQLRISDNHGETGGILRPASRMSSYGDSDRASRRLVPGVRRSSLDRQAHSPGPNHRKSAVVVPGYNPQIDMTASDATALAPLERHASTQCAGWLLWLALAGLVLRLAVIASIPTTPVSDFWAYHQKALLMLHEGRYGGSPEHPDATFTPGYPLWLAGLFALTPGLPTVTVAKLANAALGALAVWLAGVLARRLGGRGAGITAAAAAAVYPPFVLLPVLLASENLFLPLVLAFLLVATRLRGRPAALRAATIAGALVGAAALVRPVAYLMGLT